MQDARPLVLLSRPRAASEALAGNLRGRLDADLLVAPVIGIEPIGAPVDTGLFGAVIFTSVHGVARAVPLPGQTAWCVGDTTARAAERAGFAAVSAGGDAAALLAEILRTHPARALLHVRGEHGAGQVAQRLRAAGYEAAEAVAYRQTDRALAEDEIARIGAAPRLIAPVFSPRSARRLSVELAGVPQAPTPEVIAISAAAGRAWTGPGQVRVVSEPSGAAMTAAIVDAVRRDSPC